MATNRPCGLFPIVEPYGNISTHLYKANTSKAIFKYDPVQLDANGTVTLADTGGVTVCLGVAIGFLDLSAAGLASYTNPHLPVSTQSMVVVCDDPNQKYIMQCDTGGGNLSLTNIGNVADANWFRTTTGDTTTGISNMELDSSTATTGTGGLVVIRGFLDAVDNTTGNWCKVVVTLNKPQLHASNLGAGI